MNIITAPESLDYLHRPAVFLAGGITNCPWWQDEVIDKLADANGTILNPRRRNFPIDVPGAAREQIRWEFVALQHTDIFSIWFCNADSDQPICMYELGRHLARAESRDGLNYANVCIGVEPGYRREADVRVQTELVSVYLADRIAATLDKHVWNIRTAVRRWYRK